MLCGDEGGSGWLFLSMESGLELRASNRQAEDSRALVDYARSHFEVELRAAALTATAGALTVQMAGPTTEAVVDVSAEHQTIPLRAWHDGIEYVVGVAIVVGSPLSRGEFTELASGLARHLITIGVCCPREAA